MGKRINPETKDLLVTWNRSSSIPVVRLAGEKCSGNGFPGDSQVFCPWFTGFIANRSHLVKELDLPQNITDCQLLVHLYQRHGSRTAQYLTGQFAWILWDGKRRELIAAGDRMGNHGLYYTLSGDSVLLSNRVEPLLNELPGSATLNSRSIVGMLHGDAPLAGETFYENINAVEWGGLLTITPKNIHNTLYWKLEPQPLLRLSSDTEYADALRELLFKVAAEYTPPYPSGIMLSSGMDSTSAAVSICRAVPTADLTAFTWATPGLPEADESHYASLVSKHLDIPMVNIRVDLYWPLSSLEGIKTPKSEPCYNGFAEAWSETYREVNQRKINVLFTGSGGDNLFGGGINAYPDLLLSGRWIQLVRQFRTQLTETKMTFKKMVRRHILVPIFKAYMPGWPKPKSPVPWLGKQYHDLYRETFGRTELSRCLLPGRQLRLVVLGFPSLRLAMARGNAEGEAHGIQFRHPLLDHRLIEFAASLPASQSFRPGNSKFILRNAMQGYLPGDVLNLQDKIIPLPLAHRGYREREREKLWPLLTDMRAAAMGFVDEKQIQAAYKDYLEDRGTTMFIYAAVLEDWLRRYF